MRPTPSDALHAAGALALVMPVAPTDARPAAAARALVVVLTPKAWSLEVDEELRTGRERELEATADLLEQWAPTRVAIDTSAGTSGDAVQLATLVATRFGHRKLFAARVARDMDAPGLFRQRGNDRFGAATAAEWYARHTIVATEAARQADVDDRLLVITSAGDGPLLRALLDPAASATYAPVLAPAPRRASLSMATPRRTAPRGMRRPLAGAA